MIILVAIVAGVAFGLASAFANRLWGTVLAVVPVLAWLALLAVALEGGVNDSETQSLGFSVCGIVVGLLVGQMLGRLKERASSVQQ